MPIAYLRNAFFRGLYFDEATRTQVYTSAGVNYWFVIDLHRSLLNLALLTGVSPSRFMAAAK